MSGANANDAQNPLIRRAYYVRPKPELANRLESIGMADAAEFLTEAKVVMSDALPFEGKLEGWRSLVLTRCKEAFLNALFEDGPLSEHPAREMLFGKDVSGAPAFDQWWIAEEIDVIEIDTTW